MNLLRLLPVFLGIIMMVLTITSPPFDRAQLTLPLTLAIGFIVARWYMSLSHQQLHNLWNKVAAVEHWPRSTLIPVCLTLLLALLPSLIRGHFPYPGNHDEMSYHLAADTYLHGRFANPSPPGWEHFESFHINVIPSYCSKFQPGMGLMLAVGQLLGHTYFGVLIALIMATLAMQWMFLQWLPARWALLATVLSCLPLCGNWSDCYFVGGPLATIAGAVMLGMYRVLLRRAPRWFDGTVLASCLVLFFWTRPFEGAIVSVCIGLPLMIRLVRQSGLLPIAWPLLPSALLVLAPAGYMQAQLNLACTGSSSTLPYLDHERQYGQTPLFLFQPVREDVPYYRHEQIRLFNFQMIDWYQLQHKPSHWLMVAQFKFGVAWAYFYGLLWLFVLATLTELWRGNGRLPLLVWFILLGLLQMVCWLLHHYLAPAFPAWSLAIIIGIRSARHWRYRNFPLGRFLVVMLIAGYAAQIAFERVMAGIHSRQSWTEQRAGISQHLQTMPGQHLVFLDYGQLYNSLPVIGSVLRVGTPQHNTGEEWAYNTAELSSQPIIWARSMGQGNDKTLISLYPQRQVWLLRVNSGYKNTQPELVPYLRP